MKQLFGKVWYGDLLPENKVLDAYRLAFEGASDHMIITDFDGRILYANQAVERITGYKREEVMGKTPAIWGKQMPLDFYKQFWRVIKEDKKPFVGELMNKRKNGEIYRAETRVSPILDQKGNVALFLGIERDVTKEREVERVKTEFISLASHQLRTPLSAMKWFLDMFLKGDFGPINDKQVEALNNLVQSNERMIRLVNSLLNVSRLDVGRVLIAPEEVDVAKLIDDVILEQESLIAARKVVIKKEFDPSVKLMRIDPKFFHEITKSLVSNAIGYSNEGGMVEIKSGKDTTSVMFEIIDHGLGIPEGDQQRVFTRFFRGSNIEKVNPEGSGMDLYVAKQLVEIMGGIIGFESKEGKGARFWFTLPIVVPEQKEVAMSLDNK